MNIKRFQEGKKKRKVNAVSDEIREYFSTLGRIGSSAAKSAAAKARAAAMDPAVRSAIAKKAGIYSGIARKKKAAERKGRAA